MSTSVCFPFEFPLESAEIQRRRALILSELLHSDAGFASTPAVSFSPSSCRTMLALYDMQFLGGLLKRTFLHLDVTLSSRLIRSAGKFIYTKNPLKLYERAEIRMSSDFLFRLSSGPFSLNGLSVATPQEAFLIVFEHELCHAVETAMFGATGHSKRFLSLANGLFGHTTTQHSLPTRGQEAAEQGFSVGSRVTFPFNGLQLTGRVSYIGKSATVFVPSLRGAYRDRRGMRYTKYRVPLELLKKK